LVLWTKNSLELNYVDISAGLRVLNGGEMQLQHVETNVLKTRYI